MKNLERGLLEVKSCFLNKQINLKLLHKSVIALPYSFLQESMIVRTGNYLERLRCVVKCFKTEVLILSKIDGRKLLRKLEKEKETVKASKLNLKEQIQRKIEKELICLKEDCSKRKMLSEEIQKRNMLKVEELEEEFRSQNAELDEDELEDALDEYMDSLPSEIFEDYEDFMDIDREFCEKKELLEDKLQELDENEEDDVIEQGELSFADISLETLIKEFAIFSLSNKGEITYPSTFEERGKLIAKISLERAISEFLNMGVEFSNEEIEYLVICKQKG